MSQESVDRIIGRIVLDAGFRDALLADPDQTLAAFDLTESEKAGMKCLDSETMDVLAHTLSERVQNIESSSLGTSLDLFTKKENET